MLSIREMLKKRPMSAEVLREWASSHGYATEWKAYLAHGVQVEDLPYELYRGVLEMFFWSRGIGLAPRYSPGGKLSVSIMVRNRFGSIRPENHTAAFVEHEMAWNNGLELAFAKLENILRFRYRPGLPAAISGTDGEPDGPGVELGDDEQSDPMMGD